MNTHKVSNRRARAGLMVLVILTGLLLFAWQFGREIGDWFYFLSYQPPERIEQLASDAGMSGRGRRLFYRTNPSLVSPEEIASRCDVHNLGCINEQGQVFILDYGNEPGYNSAVVTAAHEMLHFAYFRLEEVREKQLRDLLQRQVEQLDDRELNDYLNKRRSRLAYFDEAHSILATEYPDLLPELEEYYRQYFSDRQAVVEAFQQSKSRQAE